MTGPAAGRRPVRRWPRRSGWCTTIPGMEREAAFTRTTELSPSLFASAEAAEGMAAFREKRRPSWAPAAPPAPPAGS